jgi:hypothetical protein
MVILPARLRARGPVRGRACRPSSSGGSARPASSGSRPSCTRGRYNNIVTSRAFLAPFVLVLLISSVAAEPRSAVLPPSAAELFAHVSALTAPEMEGRASGTAGNGRARTTSPIGSRRRPRAGGDGGSFFQSFVVSGGARGAGHGLDLGPEPRTLRSAGTGRSRRIARAGGCARSFSWGMGRGRPGLGRLCGRRRARQDRAGAGRRARSSWRSQVVTAREAYRRAPPWGARAPDRRRRAAVARRHHVGRAARVRGHHPRRRRSAARAVREDHGPARGHTRGFRSAGLIRHGRRGAPACRARA